MPDDLMTRGELQRRTLRERLRERIDATPRLTARALSIAIGANHSYVSQLLDGKGGMPSADRLSRLAEELGTTTDYLTGRADASEQVRSEVAVGDRALPSRAPVTDRSLPLVGTGDCAELEVCDASGNLVAIERSSFDPEYTVRMIVRPPALHGVREAYAIEFRGDSMAPRYEAGDLGIVDPRRAYGAGDYVVVQLREGDSESVSSVIVKRLVRANARELVLEQFNPPLTFTLPRAQVLRVHRLLRDVEYWA